MRQSFHGLEGAERKLVETQFANVELKSRILRLEKERRESVDGSGDLVCSLRAEVESLRSERDRLRSLNGEAFLLERRRMYQKASERLYKIRVEKKDDALAMSKSLELHQAVAVLGAFKILAKEGVEIPSAYFERLKAYDARLRAELSTLPVPDLGKEYFFMTPLDDPGYEDMYSGELVDFPYRSNVVLITPKVAAGLRALGISK